MKNRISIAFWTCYMFISASGSRDNDLPWEIATGSLSWTYGNDYFYGFNSAVRDAVSPDSNIVLPLVAAWKGRTLILWDNGCWTAQGRNCTAACLDLKVGPGLVWNSSESAATLHNCMVFPWIVALQSAGRLTTYATNEASRFDIANVTELLQDDKWPVINDCIEAYCESSGGRAGECEKSSRRRIEADYALSEPEFDEAFWELGIDTTICDRTQTAINSDLGGIGVVVSYVLELVLVLTSWVLHHVHQGSLRRLGNKKHTNSQKQDEANLAALIAALDDFQKAQVFFVAAVQITTCIALFNPSFFGAESAAQMGYDTNFVSLSALEGIVSLQLIYYIIHSAGSGSFFLGASTAAVNLLCIIATTRAWFLQGRTPGRNSFNGEQGPEACGGFLPTQMCEPSYQIEFEKPTARAGLFLGATWFFVLAVRIVFNPEAAKSRSIEYVYFLGRLLFQVALVLGILYCLYRYSEVLASPPGILIDPADWSLGQILAVTIWIPVAAEYVYYRILGVEEGLERRLVKPYRVIKDADGQDSASHQHRSNHSSSDDAASLNSRAQAASQLPFLRIDDVS